MPPPRVADLRDLDDIISQGHGRLYEKASQWLQAYLEQPENPLSPSPSRGYPSIDGDWRRNLKPSQAVDAKYHRVKQWLHPEPGVSFTYDEWIRGENHTAVVPGKMVRGRDCVESAPKANHEFYTMSIEKTLQKQDYK